MTNEAAPEGISPDAWKDALAIFAEMTRDVEGSDDREIIARAIMAAELRGEQRAKERHLTFEFGPWSPTPPPEGKE